MTSERDRFYAAVVDLLTADVERCGAEYVLTIPGVWEAISEHYNNDAIDECFIALPLMDEETD